jgi:maleylacetate reductase
LRLLSSGLPAVKADPENLDARMDCLIAAWLSMTAVVAGVPMGASHAIGHILGGTCDVPHGYTSCIMLPAVLRWNAEDPDNRQGLVSEAFGQPRLPAGDVLDAFVASLGMPRTLTDVGISEDDFGLIAENCLHDRWLHTNPRKIGGVEDVKEILASAL